LIPVPWDWNFVHTLDAAGFGIAAFQFHMLSWLRDRHGTFESHLARVGEDSRAVLLCVEPLNLAHAPSLRAITQKPSYLISRHHSSPEGGVKPLLGTDSV
jgi:hypothetical protein